MVDHVAYEMELKDEFYTVVGDGAIESALIAQRLQVTKTQLAQMLGLSAESLRRRTREQATPQQTRLRDFVEIINRVQPWAGTDAKASAWYRSQSLPPFGGLTAERLVKDGKAEAVKRYLDQIAEGGYA